MNNDAHIDIIEQHWRPVGPWFHAIAAATINVAGDEQLFGTASFSVDEELIRITAHDGRHLVVILTAGRRLFDEAGEFRPVSHEDILVVLRWRGGTA